MTFSLFKKKVIKGTPGNDDIVGTPKKDIIIGKGGDDTLTGGNGNDILFGGKGDDLLKPGDGNDIAFGGKGNDTINGGTGTDLLIGGSGDDRLTGAGGKDFLWGGKGADTFRVDANNSKITILDFCFGEGDRIDIPTGYSFADAKIVDNGLSIFGVTVSFIKDGIVGPNMVLCGVGSVSDVHADWFI